MGCRNSSGRTVSTLEEELNTILREKDKLKEKIKKNENFSINVFPVFEKIVDVEQYETFKILEYFSALTGNDFEEAKELKQQISEISSMESHEKLLKYAELRYEQTKLQKKMFREFEEVISNFFEIVDEKYKDIDKRLDLLKRVLSNNSYFSSQITTISNQFSLISCINKSDIHFLLSKQKSLIQIENLLITIENSSPALNFDTSTNIKIAEIENSLSEVTKLSINSLKAISLNFQEENSETIDSKSLKSLDFNIETYATISESIVNWVKNLSEIEQRKENILKNNKITEELIELDKSLVFYFNNSENAKDQAFSRLQRLSKGPSLNSSFVDSFVQNTDITHLSLWKTLSALKVKTVKFLEKSSEQDKVVLEMTQKFAILDEKIDEIELKLIDFISSDIKDLYNIVPLNDSTSKALLDDLKEKLNETSKESTSDLIEHVSKSLKQIELTFGIKKIREVIRESHAEDVKKRKNELREKINELNTQVSKIQSEKSNIESNLESLKVNHDKTLEMLEEKLALLGEKDSENTSLKNSLGSLNEKYEEVIQENTLTKTEIEKLIKENRQCKKRLKSKESELEELKSKLEKD